MVATESYIPLADVPALPLLRHVVKSRRKISTPTVVRWWRRGVLAVDGRRVTLRVAKIGGLPATTEEWLGEFFAALGSADTSTPTHTAPARASSRNRVERARRSLERHRI